MRFRLVLFIILAVALPSVLFLRHAAVEQDNLLTAAEARVLRQTQNLADREHEFIQQARTLLDVLVRAPELAMLDADACDTLLRPSTASRTWSRGVTVLRTDGSVLCGDQDAALPDHDLDTWPFLRNMLESRSFMVSDYVARRGSLVPGYYAGMSLRDRQGQVRGAVLVGLDLSWMARLAGRDAAGASLGIMVVDRTGVILLRYPANGMGVGQHLADHAVLPRLMIEAEGTAFGPDLDGVDRIYGFTQMPETGTKLIVGLARADVLGAEDAEVHRTLLALGILAVFAVIIGWVGAEVVVFRSIAALTRAARRIGDASLGDPGVAELMVPRAAGALGMLADAFNRMSAGLALRERKLKRATIEAEAKRRELAASEMRFRDIAEVSADWFWERDAELRCVYLSDRFEAASGIDPSDLLGYRAEDLPVPGVGRAGLGRESVDAICDALGRRTAFRDLLCRVVRSDGTIGYWRTSGKPVFGHAGTFLGFRGIGSDVTAAQQAEATLIDAKSAAEAANRAKTDFLANMSHELRTPLNAVIGFSDLIRGQLLGPIGDPRYLGYVKDIGDSGRHLLGLINDILDMSKIEAGAFALDEDTLDLADAMNRCLRMVAVRAESAGLTLSTRFAPEVSLILADSRRFRQIMLNLLSNAIKFTPPGGRVTLTTALDPAGHLVIEIADTGIGIAEAELVKVMEPFWQADSGLNRRHEGAGLGLPLTKRLVELHGGKLTLASRIDHGTVASFRLPAARVLKPEA